MRAPGKPTVATYTSSRVTYFVATTTDGRTYYIVTAKSAGVALVQPRGCSGWAQICVGDLTLSDADGPDVMVATAIDEAFVRTT